MLSALSVVACADAAPPAPDETVIEVRYFGGCFMVGRCPRVVVNSDGSVAMQSVSLARIDTIAETTVDAAAVDAALAALAAPDFERLAEEFQIDCLSFVDGTDVQLALPGAGLSMACVDLAELAKEVTAFGDLMAAIDDGFGGDTGLLRPISLPRIGSG